MYIQDNKIITRYRSRVAWAWALILTLSVCPVFPRPANSVSPIKLDPEVQRFRSSGGLLIVVLKSNHIPFIHAQLAIYYKEPVKNPAIPYLALLNLLDRNLKESTPLLNALKKMGGDFEVEHRPDFLLLKINFLPEKMSSFIGFLKTVYASKPFSDSDSSGTPFTDEKRKTSLRNRFNDSIANYWNYFFKQDNWRNQVAYQIAYNHFFPGTILGQSLITPEDVKRVTLDQLHSFYMNNYQLPNSLLIIKGNIENPALLYGHIERVLSSFKRQPPLKPGLEKYTVNPHEKIYVFNSTVDEFPTIYWFEAVSTSGSGNPIPALVLNNVLFTYPTGRLCINARSADINNLRLQTEMVNHEGISLITNTIQLKYGDIEKFLLLVDRERKKIRVTPLERQEYLNTFSSIYGRLKVNTQDFEHDASLHVVRADFYSQKVTLASLNEMADDSGHVVIVIVGNAKMVLPQLGQSRVEVIDWSGTTP